jgi:hypothetical protein
MKSTDRTILAVVGVVIFAIGFYVLLLSPKRNQAAELNDEIAQVEESISQQEQVASFGQQAREDFPQYYGRLVVLGKAVPDGADTASMLVQLNSVAGSSGVDFIGLSLSQGGSGGSASTDAAAAPAPASTPATPEGSTTTPEATTPEAASAEASSAGVPASPTPAAATEATAANLPIGAVVGPAGLPTMPYELNFKGGYFGVAGFIGGLDGLVTVQKGNSKVVANGRLMTVDGFALKGGIPGSDPTLDASFLVTSYVTPSDQGLTAGASPTGPAPAATAPEAVPASSGTVTP